jgi:uncharacterized membrane protein YjjB (DUF3815 family)
LAFHSIFSFNVVCQQSERQLDNCCFVGARGFGDSFEVGVGLI